MNCEQKQVTYLKLAHACKITEESSSYHMYTNHMFKREHLKATHKECLFYDFASNLFSSLKSVLQVRTNLIAMMSFPFCKAA